MPSTPSAIGGIELLEPGVKFDWGDEDNARQERLTEMAKGVAIIAATTGRAITSTDYVENEHRKAVLWFDGSGPLASGQTFTVPAQEAIWTIVNDEAVSFTLSCGGVNATIPASRIVVALCDGTDLRLWDPYAFAVAATATNAANAQTAENNAEAAATHAEEWAENPEDDPVSVAAGGDNSTTFSSKHWALKSEGFRDETEGFKDDAAASAAAAATFDPANYQPIDAILTEISAIAFVAGDLMYADGTDSLTRLAKGTAGQVLTMNTGATAPEWSAPGSWTSLGTLTTTSGTTQTLSGLTAGAYKQYALVFNGVSPNGSANISVEISADGSAFSSVTLVGSQTAASLVGGVVYINSPGLTGTTKIYQAYVYSTTGGTVTGAGNFGGPNGAVTAIRVSVSAGAFDAGSVQVFGIK